uniref:Uncharacterized protein n=1 Tax=Arundo donax TaxID=35708 RepID=A0A0A9BUE8_ARUDO
MHAVDACLQPIQTLMDQRWQARLKRHRDVLGDDAPKVVASRQPVEQKPKRNQQIMMYALKKQ